jgi:hypothetical protein
LRRSLEDLLCRRIRGQREGGKAIYDGVDLEELNGLKHGLYMLIIHSRDEGEDDRSEVDRDLELGSVSVLSLGCLRGYFDRSGALPVGAFEPQR